ncbi:hypothetical protein BGZ95_010740 [Linnemannia exigua]|uniref:Uncharacterized protein n=1 Tax=Linnemannia exigua TaxID=604196 RepID=A0AAD4DAW6_9FUNG|nr:hypothetical protein BGZ95_010740 [Linnemannia exigua]
MAEGPLRQNCDPNLPESLCVLANVCGYISKAIWFLVLLPQLIKNFRRQSTTGLSFIWASCNFTASLINLFFILDIKVPLFTTISGWYMPILEVGMLLQFVAYSEVSRRRKAILVVVSSVVYATVIALEVTDAFGKEETSSKMVWVSIVLWSIETYFQVILNMRRRSISGQSYISLGLSFVGKTTDMIMQFTLLMPTQYVYMTYFSSTLAYFNFIQLVVYTQPARVWGPVVVVMSLLLCGFVALLLLRTSVVSIVCPIGILMFLVGGFVVTRRQRQRQEVKPLPEDIK